MPGSTNAPSDCLVSVPRSPVPPPRNAEKKWAVVQGSVDDVDTKEIAGLAVSGLTSVPADLHGSTEYRTRVGATRVNRALDRALLEAKNG